MAESWFSTIKLELLYRRIWRTKQEAELAIFRWIEGWYNPRRIQDNLGWRSPLEYEAAYAAGHGLVDPRHRQGCTGPRHRQAHNA